VANHDLPFLGEYEDFEVPIAAPGARDVTRVLRVWTGFVVVASQSCELEYADDHDTRVQVTPLVTSALWPGEQWELIEQRSLPGCCPLPAADADSVEPGVPEAPWPACAVALVSTTLVSGAMIRPNQVLSLPPGIVVRLQEALVRFTTVRGFGDVTAAESLVGKQVTAVRETAEMVPGPSRITKV
jgi:hypothetical protein